MTRKKRMRPLSRSPDDRRSISRGSWWRKTDVELFRERLRDLREWRDSLKPEVGESDSGALKREAARRDPRIRNLLDMVPVRRKGIGRRREFLIVPVYTTRKGKRIARFLRLRTERGIRLDDYGWSVWELSNGRRDVREVGRALKERFGDDIKPLYPKLAKFYAYLQNLKLVRIETRKGVGSGRERGHAGSRSVE